jgi:hypothetical protein
MYILQRVIQSSPEALFFVDVPSVRRSPGTVASQLNILERAVQLNILERVVLRRGSSQMCILQGGVQRPLASQPHILESAILKRRPSQMYIQ